MMVISGGQRRPLSLPASNNLSSRKYFFKSLDGGTWTPVLFMARKYGPGAFPTRTTVPDGLVARIRRFHRRGPGSIPGQGTKLLKTANWYKFVYIEKHHVENESDGAYRTIHVSSESRCDWLMIPGSHRPILLLYEKLGPQKLGCRWFVSWMRRELDSALELAESRCLKQPPLLHDGYIRWTKTASFTPCFKQSVVS